MIPPFFRLICIVVATAGLACSQVLAEELSTPDIEGILEELTTIEEVLNGTRVSTRTSAVRAFEAAASSDKAAYEFFLQCHKALNFDAKDASFTDFRAWREKNEDRLKTSSNLAAMRLQLQYLVLTMKAAEGVEREALIPQLENFVSNIASHAEDLGTSGMKTLRESVKTTIFAEAYKLNKSLELSDWCFEPGNFGDVYAKAVFPHVRSEHKEGLGAAWDRRIDLEKQFILITQEGNQYELDKFQSERLPQLYWQKAKDIFEHYSPKQGAQTMLALLKGNPNHTNLKKWLEEFRALLKSTAPAPSPTVDTPPVVDKSNPLGFE